MMLANDQTMLKLGLSAARTALAVFPHAGCGDSDFLDLVATETLARSLDSLIRDFRCVVRLCEGKKDKAPWLPEGSLYGSRSWLHPELDLFADPLEGTGQFSGPASLRTRGSSCVVGLSRGDSVARLASNSYALKLVLPPGSPDGITLETPPGEIARRLAAHFGRPTADVKVWILDRPRNHEAIAGFRRAGATVQLIVAGDVDAHLRAGMPVADAGPVHVSYGIGGLPEGVLVVPYLLWSGAAMLLSPRPTREQEAEIRASGHDHMLGREFDGRGLIDCDECMVAIAGISNGRGADAPVVEGIRNHEATGQPCATVLVASPARRECLKFEVGREGSWCLVEGGTSSAPRPAAIAASRSSLSLASMLRS